MFCSNIQKTFLDLKIPFYKYFHQTQIVLIVFNFFNNIFLIFLRHWTFVSNCSLQYYTEKSFKGKMRRQKRKHGVCGLVYLFKEWPSPDLCLRTLSLKKNPWINRWSEYINYCIISISIYIGRNMCANFYCQEISYCNILDSIIIVHFISQNNPINFQYSQYRDE